LADQNKRLREKLEDVFLQMQATRKENEKERTKVKRLEEELREVTRKLEQSYEQQSYPTKKQVQSFKVIFLPSKLERGPQDG